jgi:hypothetical protein
VVVSASVVSLGLATIATAVLHAMWALAAVMLAGGAAWVSFMSLFNVQVLNHAPDWVRARVLAVSMLVFQGAVAAGSAAWGVIAAQDGVGNALIWAGVGAILTPSLALFMPLSDTTVDLTAWNHWRIPSVSNEIGSEGPVLVIVEYDVIPEQAEEFVKAMHEYGRIRRRDGASRWGVFKDLETADRYTEIFIVSSWQEHIRQHDRTTRADSRFEVRIRNCVRSEPTVQHLLYS